MPRTKARSRRQPADHGSRQNKEVERQVKRQREDPAQGRDEAESSFPPAKKTKPNPSHDPSQDQSTQMAVAPPPPSSLSSTPTIPIDLQSTHQVTSVRIITASKIRKKVTQILELLSTTSTTPLEKPHVAIIYTKAEAASKAVSVAEIAKREMAQNGGRWFQYTQVESTLEVQDDKKLKRQGKKGKQAADVEVTDGVDEDEDMDEAFETMKTPFERAIEGKEKVRAVPVMSIYLSRVSIASLKRSLGEQSNI